MKNRAIIAAALSLFVLQFVTAANVQPVLTGAGKLLFPENATPATISASSGSVTVAAGGSNQNVVLTPSGTGGVGVGVTPTQLLHVRKNQNAATQVLLENQTAGASAQTQLRLANDLGAVTQLGMFSSTTTAYGMIASGDANVYTSSSLDLMADSVTGVIRFASGGNSQKAILDSTGKLGIGVAPSFTLDAGGDVNTSGVYRKGGTAGVGAGSTVNVCSTVAAGACTSACTLIFSGGIRTGGTCP